MWSFMEALIWWENLTRKCVSSGCIMCCTSVCERSVVNAPPFLDCERKTSQFERSRCICKWMKKWGEKQTTGWTQHPIPTKHLSGLSVARQQLPLPLYSTSLYSDSFFSSSFFLHTPWKSNPVFCLAKRFYYLRDRDRFTMPRQEAVWAALVWTGLAPGLTRFGTVWVFAFFLPPLLSLRFHRDEQQGANSHEKSGMELFREQFSPNSGEDMEQVFHWRRHLAEKTHNLFPLLHPNSH